MEIYNTTMFLSKGYGYDLNMDVPWLQTQLLEQPKVIRFVFPGEEIRISGEIQRILAKSSAVFKAMIEGDKQDVYITDMEADIFKWMLLYIHGSDLPNAKGEFNKLLAAAEKYQLYKLNSLRMISSMSQDNWVETMKRAQFNDNSEMVNALFEFLLAKANMKHIYKSTQFQDLYRNNVQFNIDFSSAIRIKSASRGLRFESHYSMPNSIKSTKVNIDQGGLEKCI